MSYSKVEGKAGIQSFGISRVDLQTERLDAIVAAGDEGPGHGSIKPAWRIIVEIDDCDGSVITQRIAAEAIITEDRRRDPNLAEGGRCADE